jgi:hypothetical protein
MSKKAKQSDPPYFSRLSDDEKIRLVADVAEHIYLLYHYPAMRARILRPGEELDACKIHAIASGICQTAKKAHENGIQLEPQRPEPWNDFIELIRQRSATFLAKNKLVENMPHEPADPTRLIADLQSVIEVDRQNRDNNERLTQDDGKRMLESLEYSIIPAAVDSVMEITYGKSLSDMIQDKITADFNSGDLKHKSHMVANLAALLLHLDKQLAEEKQWDILSSPVDRKDAQKNILQTEIDNFVDFDRFLMQGQTEPEKEQRMKSQLFHLALEELVESTLQGKLPVTPMEKRIYLIKADSLIASMEAYFKSQEEKNGQVQSGAPIVQPQASASLVANMEAYFKNQEDKNSQVQSSASIVQSQASANLIYEVENLNALSSARRRAVHAIDPLHQDSVLYATRYIPEATALLANDTPLYERIHKSLLVDPTPVIKTGMSGLSA